MPASGNGGSKKRDATNVVARNRMFVDRIRHEQQAAEEYRAKWGNEEDKHVTRETLKNTVIPTAMHSFLEKENKAVQIFIDRSGTKKEAIDQTLCRSLYPCTYHLVGKSVTTIGVSPVIKYTQPLTTSQEVGWLAHTHKDIELPFPEGRRLIKDKLKN